MMATMHAADGANERTCDSHLFFLHGFEDFNDAFLLVWDVDTLEDLHM